MPKLLNASNENDVIPKKSIGRSVAYPASTINNSREFTQTIYSHFGGNSFNTRETIGKILKKSPQILKAPISACVQYGLLEMRSSIGYKPTPRFMDLYKQDDPDIYREAMISCLKEPELYSTLLDLYKGDIVPALPVLANSLFKKHKIIENVSEKAASIFLQNLEDLDLIGNDRKLLDLDLKPTPNIEKLQEDEVIDDDAKKEPENKFEEQTRQDKEPIIDINPELFVIEVPLINSRRAKIICPMDYTTKDLKKIMKVLGAYIDDDAEEKSPLT
jgi:hypothetical protein